MVKKTLPAIVLICVAVIGWILWPKSVMDQPIGADPGDPIATDAEEAELFLGTQGPEDGAGGQEAVGEPAPRLADGLSDDERAARRARRQERQQRRMERWKSMTPEQKKKWASRRVTITPLGSEPVAIESFEILESIRESRPQIQACVEKEGGFRALRTAMQAADAGPAGRGISIAFDIAADGTVDKKSLHLTPAPPGSFYDCFANVFATLNTPVPGGDGAHIEAKLGGRGRGGGRRGRPDRPEGRGGVQPEQAP